jgi:hypothetical protein
VIGYHEASRSLRHWGPRDGVKRDLNNASRVINITWLVLQEVRMGWQSSRSFGGRDACMAFRQGLVHSEAYIRFWQASQLLEFGL